MNTLAPPPRAAIMDDVDSIFTALATPAPKATHRYASLTSRDIPPEDLQALADLYKAAMARLLGVS